MNAKISSTRCFKTVAIVSAAVLALAAGIASAQGPGARPAGGAAGALRPPPEPPMTPVEQMVTELPPPTLPGMRPVAPLAPDAPMPSADPRDLQGTWFHNQKLEFRMQRDMYGNLVPYNIDGAEILARRVISMNEGKPFSNASAKCRPPGPQWQRDLNFPFQIFQSRDWIEFVFEEYHGRWQVILDPAKSPRPADPDYMGYSLGHWNGDTLVVESRDFKQALWLDVDGTPLSAQGKLVQRIRKVDNGDRSPYLEVITTVDDPTLYLRPWSVVRTFGWHPRLTYFNEYNCEEQIGDPSIDADAGLLLEPNN